MGLFDSFFGGRANSSQSKGAIEGGRNKNDGGHDHRTNRGNDRTPAQRAGDASRRKD
ncbi:hypothetical protein [Vibrio rotiferianus]|uniref:hypothetical protein n=1 Tax=Vibrio rotiferianus TaxID=190895 RepID=UPI0002376E82|nr:hypothetical protein [Vibrio rotiferianus]